MNKIDPALLIASHPDVVGCTLAEGSALLNLQTYIYYSLNHVGAFVWDAVDEPVAFGSLVTKVCDAFDAPREVVEQDLARLVASLDEAGLVQCSLP